MNYRHHYHAGNPADVFKHTFLLLLIRALQRKEKGFLYLDTHAGRGAYDLDAATTLPDGRERPSEWPDGVGRIWSATAGPLQEYLGLVRQYNLERGAGEGGPQFYPGSPRIAAILARPVDRLALCELHEDDAEALRSDLQFAPNCSIYAMDGYTALRAMLPPRERRGLILIDPPFESPTEYAGILRGLREALQRFPSGVYAVWYPLTERARAEQFQGEVLALAPPPTLVAELQFAADAGSVRMKGCGLLVINPPWQIEAGCRLLLAELARRLALDSGAASRLDWLVPEK